MIKIFECIVISVLLNFVNADENIAATLLATENGQIYKIKVDGSQRTSITDINQTIVDLDYHLSANLIFWIDGTTGQIYSQKLNGTVDDNQILVEFSSNWNPTALAVDYLSDKLYVVDSLGKTINVFALEGHLHSIVSGTNLERPIDIVLDPHEAFMFVVDSDRIIRMNMDGSTSMSIIRTSMEFSISSITIDRDEKIIFWWDTDLKSIESSSYIGDSRKIIYNTHAEITITDLTFFDEHLYFLDENSKTISRVEANRKIKKVIDNISGDIIQLIHPKLQLTSMENPCKDNNGGCQHLCLLASKKIGKNELDNRCFCSIPHVITKDGKTCEEPQEFLLYSQKEVIKGRNLDPTSSEIVITIGKSQSLSLSIDYDYINEFVYFADANTKTIYRSDLKTGDIKSVVSYEGSASISVDWISQNLYYTDFVESTLNVISLKNFTNHKSLLENLNEPKDIIVYPKYGQIYFYDDNQIKRINADGSKLTVIYKPMVHKTLKLALDFSEERLYWCLNDLENISGNSTIQYLQLNETNYVQTLNVQFLRDVSAFGVYKDWIYVISENYERLIRLNKKTGKQLTEIVPRDRQGFYSLAVFSGDRHTNDSQNHPCTLNNGGCKKLCYGIPWSKNRKSQNNRNLMRICDCPYGERLGRDRKTCKNELEIKDYQLIHRCEPDWEFTCYNGRCIPKSQICDGVNDCLDRSDERGCSNYLLQGQLEIICNFDMSSERIKFL